MAEEKKVILTREGYEKLEKELDYYVSVRRNEISEQIAIARGFGDLSENAEYDEAKNEQSRIEAKIVEMENTLRNCIVVENDEVSTDTVGVGNTVKVMNDFLKKEQVITIVGANETDPVNLKISSESPIGAALLGKKVGDMAQSKYKILYMYHSIITQKCNTKSNPASQKVKGEDFSSSPFRLFLTAGNRTYTDVYYTINKEKCIQKLCF